jgi:hypothetical protein
MFLLITTKYLKPKYRSNCEKHARHESKNGKPGTLNNSWKNVSDNLLPAQNSWSQNTVSNPFQQTI